MVDYKSHMAIVDPALWLLQVTPVLTAPDNAYSAIPSRVLKEDPSAAGGEAVLAAIVQVGAGQHLVLVASIWAVMRKAECMYTLAGWCKAVSCTPLWLPICIFTVHVHAAITCSQCM